MYESICTKCQPEAKKTGPLDSHKKKEIPSIYVGETSRSIYERAGEHWAGYRKKKTDSHIWKHHLIHHGSQGEPEMVFKVLGQFRSALTRQISEAVQIRGRGSMALNSKAEYDRCRIHRLTVDQPDDGRTTWTESDDGKHQDGSMGEQFLLDKRKQMDMEVRKSYGPPVVSMSSKRKDQVEDPDRPGKRRKYVLVSKDWGMSNNKGLDCLKEDKEKMDRNIEELTGPLETKNSTTGGGGRNQDQGGEDGLTPLPSPLTIEEEGNGKQQQREDGNTKDLRSSGEVGEDMEQEQVANLDLKVSTKDLVNINDGSEVNKRPMIRTEAKDVVSTNDVGGNTKFKQVGILNFMKKKDVGNQELKKNVEIRNENLNDVSMNKDGKDDGMMNTENLYDTAMNIVTLRSMRGECKIVRGWCKEHNIKATRTSKTERVWTWNKKTGLYAWKNRKLSVLKCTGHMGTLPRTMDSIDGVGGTQLAGWEKASDLEGA